MTAVPADDDVAALLRWVARQPDAPDLEVACAEHPDLDRGPGGVTVVRLGGCAADLPAAGYLAVLAGGARSLLLRLDGCARVEEASAQAALANAVLAECGRGEVVVVALAPPRGRAHRTVHRATTLPVSRRSLLLLGARHDRSATPDGDTPPDPSPRGSGPSAQVTGRSPERTAVLDALGPLVATHPHALDALPAPSAALDATGCTACGVCARACPHGALDLMRLPAAPQVLRHDASACEDCGICVELCPEHVLVRTGARSWGEVLRNVPVTLATVVTRRCARCGAEHGGPADPADPGTGAATPSAPATSDLCPVCAFRRAHPFSSRVVPGAPVARG